MRSAVQSKKMDRINALKRVLFLKELSDTARNDIAASGYEKRLENGETLFREGERSLGFIVVLTGRIKVLKLDNNGRELTLGIEQPGGSVGDLALFDGGNYPSCAEACADDTTVFIVPRDRFTLLEKKHPEITQGAIRALAIQSRKLIEMLKAQSLHTVRSRLASYLLQTAGSEFIFPLSETNAVIGSHVGTVREVVSRTLHSLEDEGAIRLQGRVVTICDSDVLQRIARINGS